MRILDRPDDDAEAFDRLCQERLKGRGILGDADTSPQGGGQCRNTRTLRGGEEAFEPTGCRGAGLLEVGEDRSSAVGDDDNLKVGLRLTDSSPH